MWGVKQVLLMIAVMMGQTILAADKKPLTKEESANQGKLRDLDINIAMRHILQTIVGIARWYTEEPVDDEDHLVEQTVDYNMSAILKVS